MEDRDTRPVIIERSDAIDAAGALVQLARVTRKEVRSRRYVGPENKSMRKYLRELADHYDLAAQRVQRVADEAF